MTHGSLYSGIGGWLLAARWAGIENIFTVEIDGFCNKVLKKHFKVEQYKDIKEFNGEKYRGAINILSTSDPCQPFSFAGKQGGKADDRFLWSQTVRVIREIRPSYVVFENVIGFISMAFEIVASDLENEGYTVESFIIPACAVGAWHRRDRLWIIAYSNSQGLQESACGQFSSIQESKESFQGSSFDGAITERWGYWTTEPNVGRVAHGIPSRVDRLKSLGNSIVPQIAYIIFEAIKQYNTTLKNQ